MSENGPVARPAGFHQVAVLSAATATNAPPIPSARLPTLSTICAEESPATATRRAAKRIERILAIVGKPSSYQECHLTSLAARMYGVISRPRATFTTILQAPSWAPVLATTTAITFLCGIAFLRTDVGQQALVDQWERTATAFGQTVDDAAYAR